MEDSSSVQQPTAAKLSGKQTLTFRLPNPEQEIAKRQQVRKGRSVGSLAQKIHSIHVLQPIQQRQQIIDTQTRLFRVRKLHEIGQQAQSQQQQSNGMGIEQQPSDSSKYTKVMRRSKSRDVPFFLQNNKPLSVQTQTELSCFQCHENTKASIILQNILQQESQSVSQGSVFEVMTRRSRFFLEHRMCTQEVQTELSYLEEKDCNIEQVSAASTAALQIGIQLSSRYPYDSQNEKLSIEIQLREQFSQYLDDCNIFYKKVVYTATESPYFCNLLVPIQINLNDVRQQIFDEKVTNIVCCLNICKRRFTEDLAQPIARINFPLLQQQPTNGRITIPCGTILNTLLAPKTQKRFSFDQRQEQEVPNGNIISMTLKHLVQQQQGSGSEGQGWRNWRAEDDEGFLMSRSCLLPSLGEISSALRLKKNKQNLLFVDNNNFQGNTPKQSFTSNQFLSISGSQMSITSNSRPPSLVLINDGEDSANTSFEHEPTTGGTPAAFENSVNNDKKKQSMKKSVSGNRSNSQNQQQFFQESLLLPSTQQRPSSRSNLSIVLSERCFPMPPNTDKDSISKNRDQRGIFRSTPVQMLSSTSILDYKKRSSAAATPKGDSPSSFQHKSDKFLSTQSLQGFALPQIKIFNSQKNTLIKNIFTFETTPNISAINSTQNYDTNNFQRGPTQL